MNSNTEMSRTFHLSVSKILHVFQQGSLDTLDKPRRLAALTVSQRHKAAEPTKCRVYQVHACAIPSSPSKHSLVDTTLRSNLSGQNSHEEQEGSQERLTYM